MKPKFDGVCSLYSLKHLLNFVSAQFDECGSAVRTAERIDAG